MTNSTTAPPPPRRPRAGRRALGVALAAIAALLATAPAHAQLPLDLGGLPAMTYVGDEADGTNVAVAGDCDVNGDGRDDLLIAIANPDGGAGRGTPGKAYAVLQGQQTLSGGQAVATIAPVGVTDRWEVGADIACVGDVNSDGIDDIALGAPGWRLPGETSVGPGAAFVVFGGAKFRAGATVDVAPLGAAGAISSDGYRIEGEATRDRLGMSVAGVGDVDGDGQDDVLVGDGDESAYLTSVFLAAAPPGYRYIFPYEPIPVAAAGEGLLARYDGLAVNSSVAHVAGAGDVDGDGVGDLLLGAQDADPDLGDGPRTNAGSAYALSGAARGRFDVGDAPGAELLAAYHGGAGDELGAGLAGAGDVDGDGRGDVLVGGIGGTSMPGHAWVLYSPEPGAVVDVSALAPGAGYAIEGPAANSRAGNAVATLGDIDGDEVPDHLVGAPRFGGAGAAYVVYGQAADPQPVALSDLEEDEGARYVASGEPRQLGRDVATGGVRDGAPALLLARGGAATAVTLAQPSTGGGGGGGTGGEDVETARADWGFRASFRAYVAAGNGAPPIAASDGATCPANPNVAAGGCDPKPRASADSPPPSGALLWTPVGATWDLEAGEAEVTTRGRVLFSYPAHFFTLALEDPVFRVAGDEVTVEARVDLDSTLDSVPSVDSRVTLGRFQLAEAASETDATVTWRTGAGAITAEAATVLGGFLAEGAELDPATITIPKALGPPSDPPPPPAEGDGDGDGSGPPPERTVIVERVIERRVAAAPVAVRTARWRRVGSRRTVHVATVACRAAEGCRVRAPRVARLRVGGTAFRARTVVRRQLRHGQRARVLVRLPRRAVSRLAGRRAVVRLPIAVRGGDRTLRRVARVVVRARGH
ncbi:MAG: hypothetical protein GXY03_11340 [Solirubrobacterales bacterium]|nr:hypothetical protein [Solirubrobacterales bacterium]